MKIAFLTEMGFEGYITEDHSNARTEYAWFFALNAKHICIYHYQTVKDYDFVFVIFPKGRVFLDAVGSRISNEINPVSDLLSQNVVDVLKQNNKKVFFVQEGPHWLFNDYEIRDQINFYNLLTVCDGIFAHNKSDVDFYMGLVPGKPVNVIPTLMIEHTIKDIIPKPEDKVIIGGNFGRWYGGFQSYIVAQELESEIWTISSHAQRENEEQLVKHLPRVMWTDWMKQLSTFKYAIHLMPTVAAGTFSLNTAYLGIPTIGNKLMDTQKYCHPMLSVDVEDIDGARCLSNKLKNDTDFYNECSLVAKDNYRRFYDIEVWKNKMDKILDKLK